MLINTSALFGEKFEYFEEANIMVEKGKIIDASLGYVSGALDCKNYLAMPSFFNAHTHLGDSFAKEAVLGLSVSQAVGKNGLKWKLYESSKPSVRIESMAESLDYMISSGTTSFSDFRENGLSGINELKSALNGRKIKHVILGRDVSESECDGLGLNLYQANQIQKNRSKILALHAGEKEGEVSKALLYSPDVIIHSTKAEKKDFKKIAKDKISIVVCPRSNSLLGAGFPKVRKMLDAKINVALGTDNVMLNSPDMFREMEYLSKASYLAGEPLSPSEILKMASFNGSVAFNKDSGLIAKGMAADLMFIDRKAPGLLRTRNILASIIHRCGREDVRKVMIDGSFVFDKRGA